MNKAISRNRASRPQSGFLVLRLLVSCALSSCAASLAVLAVAATPSAKRTVPDQVSTLNNPANFVSASGSVMSPSSQVWFEGDDNVFSKVVAANGRGQASSVLRKRESTLPSQDQGSTRDTTSTANGSWSIADAPQAKGALTKNFLGGATCVS